LAKAMRGVRWLFFFWAAGVALAWLVGAPWEPWRAGRRIFSRAYFFSLRALVTEKWLAVLEKRLKLR
jgi:hypothetical protein